MIDLERDATGTVKDFAAKKEGYDKLPDEALVALEKLVNALN